MRQKTSYILIVTHLQLLQDKLVSKHINFQIILDFNVHCPFAFHVERVFLDLVLVYPWPFKLFKKDTKWGRYGC
jgi:hypothetical protein